MRSRRLYALFGLLSTIVGMAVGHLVAALIHPNPDASPVLAVGSTVVELTPVSVEQWGIRHFETDGFLFVPAGQYDKVVLVGSVMIGALVLAAIAGILTRRRFAIGGGLVALLVVVAGVAALTRAGAEVIDVVPSLVTLATGLGALWVLDRTARGLPIDPRATAATGTGTSTGGAHLPSAMTREKVGAGSGGPDVVTESGPRAVRRADGPDGPDDADGTPGSAGPSRRGVVIAMGALAAIAAVFAGAGRLITGVRARDEDITLPQPAEKAPAFPRGLDDQVPGITPLRVSNGDFYRVDTRLDTPVVSSDGWSLTVDGDVSNQLSISFDELLGMNVVERDITLTCVSNSVGGKYVGGARWLGVPLKDVLDRAGVGGSADQLLQTDFDGMTISTPLDLATDGREALIAFGMNGEPLPREHGFPVRMVIPGLYGFISATKWLTKLTLTTYAEQEAYWTKRGWDTRAPIKPSARIDTPRALSQSGGGSDLIVGGVAWAQNDGGVQTVQVQVDGSPWQDAMLGPDVNNVYWRQWFLNAGKLDPGQHNVKARVVDGDGQTQTDAKAEPFPGGSSGIHSIVFSVT